MPPPRRFNRFRRRINNRRRKVSKVTAYSRKGAAAQARQIWKLQKQVNSVRNKVKDVTQYRQYNFAYAVTQGGGLTPSYAAWSLVQPDQWGPIFQTPSGHQTLAPNKFRGRSVGIEGMIQLADPAVSQAPVTGTIFLCSLRKEVAKQFVENATNGTGMISGVHYITASMGTVQGSGMTMLNKGIFKIHYVRRFMLGGKTNFEDDYDEHDTAPTTNLKDNNVRFYIKHRYQNLIKSDGPDSRSVTSTGGFKDLTVDTLEPQDQLYLFIFSNAYDGQALSIHANAVFTGQTSN